MMKRWMGSTLVLICACGPKAGSGGTADGTSDGTAGTNDDTVGGSDDSIDGSGTGGPGDTPVSVSSSKDVDILFVVDNSGTMAEEQIKLVAGVNSLIDVLDSVGASYRIGITTTDNGNPWCNATSPEGGALRATSCRSRTQEFVFNGAVMIDASQEACLDLCSYDQIDLQPTTTSEDPDPKPRPWLERVAGETNLPDSDGDGSPDMTMVDAFACVGPQGIDGCGFEQHLESMYKALARMDNAEEPAYGFRRAGATLAVLIVSDEVDCSYNGDWSTIFLPTENGGNEVFWTDPDTQSSPTSAVCWNAGVTCTGKGSPYAGCFADNKNVDGDIAASESDAVLHPISRYVDRLQSIEDMQQELQPGHEIIVSLLAGVPEGYESGDVDLVYQDALDPQEQLDFGIGPGCESADGIAFPPVREREVAEAFETGGQRNVYSICAADYGPAFSGVVDAIREQLRPACMPACVADVDPLTPDVLDVSCMVTQESPTPEGGIDSIAVPECPGGALPDSADVCWVALVGASMDPYCSDEGWNLQFTFVRREGVPAPSGSTMLASCELSQQKAIDCPNLP